MAERVVIVGGGLAGLAAATALAGQGFARHRSWSRATGWAGGPAASPTQPPDSWSMPASMSAWAAAPTWPTFADRRHRAILLQPQPAFTS